MATKRDPDTVETDQKDVIACLKALDAAVEVIQTHGALVFLTETRAYKIKRPVKYDYLDFSTLQLRHQMLARELELNAPGAPSIYLGLVAVTRNDAGGLELGGTGEVVEWVLEMNRFPAEDELSYVAEHHGLTDEMSQALGTAIAQYHTSNEIKATGGADLIRAIIEELERVFAEMTDILDPDLIQTTLTACKAAHDQQADLLNTRARQGMVRRCHGDLHLRNIVVLDGVPTPFDALEFDEVLGTCDILYDLAFLLMDLAHRGMDRAANLAFDAYLYSWHKNDNLTGLAALPLFLAVRSAIRAMVDGQTARFQGNDPALVADAVRYLEEARAYLTPPKPRLIAVGGISGTGKSTIARAIAHQIGVTPGAVHLRSDTERKALFHVSPLTHLPQDAYTPEISQTVYKTLRNKAALVLKTGHSALLDAVHLHAEERDACANLAESLACDFTGIWLEADTDACRTRVDARTNDASDADASVIALQTTVDPGPNTWTRVNTSGDLDTTLARVRAIVSPEN